MADAHKTENTSEAANQPVGNRLKITTSIGQGAIPVNAIQPGHVIDWPGLLPRPKAFDERHAPDPELIADCVHCGFCLPACPTYNLWGEEMDSPRGRIYLMKMGLEGKAEMNATFVRHFDQCLGCMACMTACPSGVQYDKLIEATRSQIEKSYPRTLSDRLFRETIFALFPYPKRLRLLLLPLLAYKKLGVQNLVRSSGMLDRLPKRLAQMEAMMPTPTLAGLTTSLPERVGARGKQRRRVGMLTGCVQSVFFSQVNTATMRVLSIEGCEVIIPRLQGCCGALSMHAGREAQAQQFARTVIDAFEEARVDNVIVNAAGCGSTMKEYGHLLRDDPRYAERANAFSAKVRDVSEFLSEIGPVAKRYPLPLKVAYHDACHLAHAQNIRRQPRQVLRGIPGLTLVDIAEPDMCCGSAGIYNLVEPDPANELGDRKVKNVLATQADMIVTSNPGCLLQIQASLARLGKTMPAFHPVEVLEASLRHTWPRGVPRQRTQ